MFEREYSTIFKFLEKEPKSQGAMTKHHDRDIVLLVSHWMIYSTYEESESIGIKIDLKVLHSVS